MQNNLRQKIELLYVLVNKELKVRYKNSVLGYLWAIANPFAFAIVYYVAFKLIMRIQVENYSIFLITAMFPWLWISNAIVKSTTCYRSNHLLIKKVNLRRDILLLSSVVHEMVHYLFSIPVIILFIGITGGVFHLSWIWQIPLLMLIQLALIYPMALILALGNVYVKDIEYLTSIAFSMLFFLTPIVYPVSMVPDRFRGFFGINPFHHVITSWRGVFLEGTVDIYSISMTLLFVVTACLLAYFIYMKTARKIAELL